MGSMARTTSMNWNQHSVLSYCSRKNFCSSWPACSSLHLGLENKHWYLWTWWRDAGMSLSGQECCNKARGCLPDWLGMLTWQHVLLCNLTPRLAVCRACRCRIGRWFSQPQGKSTRLCRSLLWTDTGSELWHLLSNDESIKDGALGQFKGKFIVYLYFTMLPVYHYGLMGSKISFLSFELTQSSNISKFLFFLLLFVSHYHLSQRISDVLYCHCSFVSKRKDIWYPI